MGIIWTCSPELGDALLGAGLEEPVFFHFPLLIRYFSIYCFPLLINKVIMLIFLNLKQQCWGLINPVMYRSCLLKLKAIDDFMWKRLPYAEMV